MKETTVPQTQQQSQVAETREPERTLTPPVDIYETEDGLTVVVDLPGVAKGDVDVNVENDLLTISGKASTRTPGEKRYQEYALANYFRQFQLSEKVDREKIQAEIKHGVLKLHLPKAEAAKPKKISVKVAS